LGSLDKVPFSLGDNELFGPKGLVIYIWLRNIVELSDKSKVLNISVVLVLVVKKIGLLEEEV
jgi:hypothetical protein